MAIYYASGDALVSKDEMREKIGAGNLLTQYNAYVNNIGTKELKPPNLP
jgi:hypothetical protein